MDAAQRKPARSPSVPWPRALAGRCFLRVTGVAGPRGSCLWLTVDSAPAFRSAGPQSSLVPHMGAVRATSDPAWSCGGRKLSVTFAPEAQAALEGVMGSCVLGSALHTRCPQEARGSPEAPPSTEGAQIPAPATATPLLRLRHPLLARTADLCGQWLQCVSVECSRWLHAQAASSRS